MEPQSDEALIKKIRSGSRATYGQLMERYERLVMKVVLSYTHNVEDAFDVSQDVFFKAYRKLDQFRGTGQFKAWLLRITHNESISWLRKQKRFQEHETFSPENSPCLPADQDTALMKAERRRMLQDEILQLNARQQTAVTLRYFEGMPIREIAGVLECGEGVVKSILFRSLEKMRKRLHTQRRDQP